MNKSQGTTMGAVLLAALLFRAGGPGAPIPGNTATPATAMHEAGASAAGDGPWAASCKYWAPARRAGETTDTEPFVNLALTENGRSLNGSLTGHSQAESECEQTVDKKWGLPQTSNVATGTAPYNLKVTAVIATVADPAHTNLGFQFDRTIDSIIEAAGANGYVSTYYWLPQPWMREAGKRKGKGTEDANAEQDDSLKGHEPGLIIFRHFEPGKASSDSSSVLYLFLVGETPTSGVDGFQIQRAFRYEDELKKVVENAQAFQQRTFARSFRAHDALAIIGPTFSGSAFPLRQAIDSEFKEHGDIHSAYVSGTTATRYAADVVAGDAQCTDDQSKSKTSEPILECQKIHYSSFELESVFAEQAFAHHVEDHGGDASKVAILVEDGTAFGQAVAHYRVSGPMIIRFPREISMLRNAETEHDGDQNKKDAVPSPYLHLSLKDSNISDSVPHLSGQMTPFSQESELMAIQRDILRKRASYVVISSTNILDALFLAQFLHRAVPDTRLVFERADLLFEREIDDEAYIGSLAITPYPLTWLRTFPFPDSYAQEYYNAASYTFWDGNPNNTPKLEGMKDFPGETSSTHMPPLWLTAVGSDGYYPLGMLDSEISSGLPEPELLKPVEVTPPPKVQPALAWYFLCLFVSILCLLHATLMCVADYWSPFTRDLDIKHNDQPYRRSMCIHISTFMLFCMAVVVTWPLFACGQIVEWNGKNISAAIVTLIAGSVTLTVTLIKTRKYWHTPSRKLSDAWFYNLFNTAAAVTLLFVSVVWLSLCSTELWTHDGSKANWFFAYRCLNPASGVSPLVPIILLLFSWYLWSYFQTLRLRFSHLNRPRLPDCVGTETSQLLYVSDDALKDCERRHSVCLFRNIECLLITREVILRFLHLRHKRAADISLRIGYICIFLLLTVWLPFVQGIDRVLWKAIPHGPTLYEFMIRALFFPLLVIALTGWLRMVLVWGSLKRGLLQRLEDMPIRFAFDRIKGTGWVAMFRQSGLREQWRDMNRSSESMRQIVHDPVLMRRYEEELAKRSNSGQAPGDQEHKNLLQIYDELNRDTAGLLKHYTGEQPDETTPLLEKQDRRIPPEELSSTFMNAIELHYAAFAEELLDKLLIPYWKTERQGVVQSKLDSPDLCKALRECLQKTEESSSRGESSESSIQAAEEFLAIRYVSLIRAVLVNLRYLITFISTAFALGIIAWNSYPFEPHQLINWIFTILLAFLGSGVVWVFAQMHRDSILSRITDKKPNELGLDFYLRILSFGAVPVLTWLAYNIPTIGGPLFQLLKPGVEVMK